MKSMRNCLQCGKEFSCYHDGKFCSYQCYWDSKKRRVEVTCGFCGDSFMTFPGERNRRTIQYCSKECYRQGYRGEVCGSYKGGRVSLTCLICGRDFERHAGEVETAKYCSPECNGKAKYRGGLEATLERRHSRPDVRLSTSVSRGIRNSIRSDKGGRHWEEVVGYTLPELMAHLEAQFQRGMTWDNYGKFGWHIDHIRPISSFDFNSPEDMEFKECWSLWNLQPMWAKANHSKGPRCENPPLPLIN